MHVYVFVCMCYVGVRVCRGYTEVHGVCEGYSGATRHRTLFVFVCVCVWVFMFMCVCVFMCSCVCACSCVCVRARAFYGEGPTPTAQPSKLGAAFPRERCQHTPHNTVRSRTPCPLPPNDTSKTCPILPTLPPPPSPMHPPKYTRLPKKVAVGITAHEQDAL